MMAQEACQAAPEVAPYAGLDLQGALEHLENEVLGEEQLESEWQAAAEDVEAQAEEGVAPLVSRLEDGTPLAWRLEGGAPQSW